MSTKHQKRVVTVYRQQQLGVSGSVEFPSVTTVASIENKDSKVPQEKQQTLWSMIENSCTDMSKEQADQLYQLPMLYCDIFVGSDEKVGHSNKIQHKIDTASQSSKLLDSFHLLKDKKSISYLQTCKGRMLLSHLTAHGHHQLFLYKRRMAALDFMLTLES